MARKPGQNRRDALALGLARGLTVRRAATEAGLSVRTAFRWLADADFRREISNLRGRLVDRACGLLAAGNAGAAVALRKLLEDDSPSVRLQAAKCILETGLKLRDAAEFEQRLENVERRLQGLNHDQQGATCRDGTRSR